jgi:hypothetical protein
MAAQWKEITKAVCDPVDAAIEQMKAIAFDKFDEVIKSGESKTVAGTKFGVVLAESEQALRMLGDDKRIELAISDLYLAYSRWMAGKDPFSTDDEPPF